MIERIDASHVFALWREVCSHLELIKTRHLRETYAYLDRRYGYDKATWDEQARGTEVVSLYALHWFYAPDKLDLAYIDPKSTHVKIVDSSNYQEIHKI